MCSSRNTRAAVATFKRRLVACARSRRFRSGGSCTLSGPTRFGLTVDFTITTYITTATRADDEDLVKSTERPWVGRSVRTRPVSRWLRACGYVAASRSACTLLRGRVLAENGLLERARP